MVKKDKDRKKDRKDVENIGAEADSEKKEEARVEVKAGEASDYEFIKEKIKDRPINRKKLLKRMVVTVASAIIFGFVACITFLLLEPTFGKLIHSDASTDLQMVSLEEKSETVSDSDIYASVQDEDGSKLTVMVVTDPNEEGEEMIVEETPIESMTLEEEQGSEASTENSGPDPSRNGNGGNSAAKDDDEQTVGISGNREDDQRREEGGGGTSTGGGLSADGTMTAPGSTGSSQHGQDQESPEEETENIQITPPAASLELDDYRLLYRKMYALTTEVSKSLVTVTGVSSDVDWMNETVLSTYQTTGLILADNGYELLVLADSDNLKNADSIRMTFCDSYSADAYLKRTDSNTGLAIYAVRLTTIPAATRQTYTFATLGSSLNANIMGNAVIAMGSPLGGSAPSVCYGAVTSTANMVNFIDASYQMLTTDIYGSPNANGVLINVRGQIVGVICSKYHSAGMENLIYAYGVSSIRNMVERMSNNIDSVYLGLTLNELTDSVKDQLGLPDGVYISQIEAESPAWNAGLSKGDLIQMINTAQIHTVNEYMSALRNISPGDTVNITYARLSGDDYKTLRVELEVSSLEEH